MATRLWLGPTTAPSVSPAFSAEWDITSTALRRKLLTAYQRPQSTTTESVIMTEATTTANQDLLGFQMVSEPLTADVTITGTLKALLRARESSTSADMRAQLIAKVVSGDGSTVRGVLYAGNTAALSTEFSSSTSVFISTWFPQGASTGVTLSSVSALSGDRIVIEVGARSHNVSATSYNSTIENTAYLYNSDYTTSGTNNSSANPWIEFSQNLPLPGQLFGGMDADTGFSGAPVFIFQMSASIDAGMSPAADLTLWDQRTYLGTASLTANADIGAAVLDLLEYDWISGSMDAAASLAGTTFDKFLIISGTMDADTGFGGVFSRSFIMYLVDPTTIAKVNINYLTSFTNPLMPLLFAFMSIGTGTVSTSMRIVLDIHAPFTLPSPPGTHTPPAIDPENPEAAIDVTPPVASGLMVRALHGVVVDMSTPTVVDGTPT